MGADGTARQARPLAVVPGVKANRMRPHRGLAARVARRRVGRTLVPLPLPDQVQRVVVAALGAQGMVWDTSPAAAELEETVMNWLKTMCGLPANWQLGRWTSQG